MEQFITNTDTYCRLSINKVVREEMLTKGIELYINKEVLARMLSLNNLNKEDLIHKENIKMM